MGRCRAGMHWLVPCHAALAWYGMAWHGMAWHGMAWHGMTCMLGGQAEGPHPAPTLPPLQLEARIRAYFGANTTKAHLKMAEAPTGKPALSARRVCTMGWVSCRAHVRGAPSRWRRRPPASQRSAAAAPCLGGCSTTRAFLVGSQQSTAVQPSAQGGRGIQRLCRSGLKAVPDQRLLQLSSSWGSAQQLQADPSASEQPLQPRSPADKNSSMFNESYRMQAPQSSMKLPNLQ